MYKFYDKYNLGEPYVYIHPYRQEDVRRLVEQIPDWVQYLIVFGSSVRVYCKMTSDLDLCVIGPGKFSEDFLSMFENGVDVIYYDSVCNYLGKVKQIPFSASGDSYRKGVVVYARQD